MRRLLLAVVLCGVVTPARAEPPSPPGIADRPQAAARRDTTWGDGKTDGTQPIEEPAKGPPYNLTHIAYASIIMLAMLAFTVWLIRRNTRRR